MEDVPAVVCKHHLKTGLEVQDLMLSIQQLLADLALLHLCLIQ